MKIEITIDSDEFWARLVRDVRAARHSVRIQTLSFEGDLVGTALADLLAGSTAPDRRILVDSYTRFIISDRVIHSPANLLDRGLRAEVRETRRMIERLKAGGVGVKFTNPVGPFLNRFPARNHKKLILIDNEIAYLGGINFSEHNFAWHDMMLRFEDPTLHEFLSRDFEHTWAGRNQNTSGEFGDVEIHLLNGRASGESFETIFRVLDRAEREIVVQSPYLSFPFVEKLEEAQRRGVAVHVITPERNNYQTMKDYLLWRAPRAGIAVWLYPERMTHLKAMLVDDRELIVGSANFDWLSFAFCQEIVAIIRDTGVIADFRKRVVTKDLRESERFTGPARPVKGRLADLQLRTVSRALGAIARLNPRA
ncbi:MAG: phosphatidylserine/phosphatidylglycerophosphate/cardiolipin synthase family protein [Gemmatimonadetes bacterium]|nr:phosphatidylserine/phosphatidylglycerophosphate/cardiolipin synthase family protein [Gemmatimonadota bacterium]